MSSIEEPLRQRRQNNGNEKSFKKSSSKLPKENKAALNRNRIAAAHADLYESTSSTVHRLWTRTVIIIAVMTIVYFYTKNKSGETELANARETSRLRMQKFHCSPTYQKEIQKYSQCVPQKCGRFITDNQVEAEEVEILLDLARRVIGKTGGSSGGASVLDIHSGALSHGEEFVNMLNIPEIRAEIKEEHLNVYNNVKRRIKGLIAGHFGISPTSLYPTYPTFFSRITNASAKTMHDEYWHEHVDMETYESFHYTSLLYLNTYGRDFKGGRFRFVSYENRNSAVIEPRACRISAFTSGAENRHHVENVTMGERYAITISFTCNQKFKIADPKVIDVNTPT